MGQFRIVTESRNIISGSMFLGILLIEIGLSWVIGSTHIFQLRVSDSFDLMFGSLLLAHGLLKRGHPYRIGRAGTFLGLLFLSFGAADYYGLGGYSWPILFILVGVVIVYAALWRRL